MRVRVDDHEVFERSVSARLGARHVRYTLSRYKNVDDGPADGFSRSGTKRPPMTDENRDGDRGVEQLRSRAPGEESEDPYEDVDVSTLPDWWRRAVETFEAHGLRPYRPPRFEDGTLAHEAIDALESELGVEVTLGSVDTEYRERWAVRVDGEPIGTVGRRRSPEGYTVYETDPGEFRQLVCGAVD